MSDSAGLMKSLMEQVFVDLKRGFFDNREILHHIKEALLISAEALRGNMKTLDDLKSELLKSVMERVYFDLKQAFKHGELNANREVLQKIKEILLRSKENLATIVDIVYSPQPSTQQMRAPSPIRDILHGRKFYRPRILMVNDEGLPVHLHITVSIPKVISHQEKSMFSNSKSYVSYELHTYVQSIVDSTACVKERRYNDFCEFYEGLRKLFPLSTIPPLPPKRAIGEKLKDEWILEPRRRQL